MVGIVIVAHSSQLAEGVIALAKNMLREQIPLAAAAGIDDEEQPFGTDAASIVRAIESVFSNDGVVVLMDMGSALLSAETALDFLALEKRSKVRLCEAPLVEGAIAAAVRAEGGGTLDEVIEEARGALKAKASQLALETKCDRDAEYGVQKSQVKPLAVREIRVMVRNRLGLHARPAARFVTTASHFQSEITVRNITKKSLSVSARSINLLTTLGVEQGDEISITASGPDASDALGILSSLIKKGFGEAATPDQYALEVKGTPGPLSIDGELNGTGASPGIAIGPSVLYQPVIHEVPQKQVQNAQEEWQRLTDAVQIVRDDIRSLRNRVMGQTENGAAIFDAHILSLEDPALIQKARQSIFGNGVNAEKAWETAVDQMMNGYRSIDSSYLRARAVDLMELKASVLRILLGDEPFTFSLDKSGVVVAADLGPSDIARLEHDKVLGICTAFGGAASHGAILARALDIPAVVGIGPEILRFAQGNLLVLDGNKGSVWVDPDDVDRFRLEQKSWLKSRKVHLQKVEKPAVTRDGKRVRVAANISSVIEVETALKYGADGIGVLRTEFLFLKRSTPPSEDEQVKAYREIARRLGSRPLVIRTLDAGGDKPLPYVGARPTVNPFLGQRGIRLCLENSDLFKTQLRAILRIGQGCCIKLLLPMVSTLQEIRRTKEYLRTAREELDRAGISSDQSMEIGIMIEVPSSVMLADRLAREVDFFSIGTNDLSQYIMASDRTDDRLSSLSDALGPAVLRSIQHTVMAAHESGIWVGLCGEIAGDVVAIPVLLGLGIDELSMNPLSIPDVKRVINRITMKRAEGIAKDVLDFDSAAEVRKALKARFFR